MFLIGRARFLLIIGLFIGHFGFAASEGLVCYRSVKARISLDETQIRSVRMGQIPLDIGGRYLIPSKLETPQQFVDRVVHKIKRLNRTLDQELVARLESDSIEIEEYRFKSDIRNSTDPKCVEVTFCRAFDESLDLSG